MKFVGPPTVLVIARSRAEGESMGDRLARSGRLEFVGWVADPNEVVPLCERRKPDVVLIDLRRRDALELIASILQHSPRPLVALSPASAAAEAAMALGATEAVSCDATDDSLVETLALMSAVRVVRRVASQPAQERRPRSEPRIAVLAASTGGPTALKCALRELPESFPIPVLVVQHMPTGFAQTFADWLKVDVTLSVRVASDSATLDAGILLAPDARQLTVVAGGILRTEPFNGLGACPSADLLLHSIARIYGARAFGAVMTGMGRDGADGLLALRRAGGATLAQDEASSVVFGMPGAALEVGAATEALSPEAIGRRLAIWGSASG